MSFEEADAKWAPALTPFLSHSTPFSRQNFEGEDPQEQLNIIAESNVLVVGAGALGCDALKCLVMSGYKNITVVDMDTIELSNLNRQFMFRTTDIGKYKSQVVADFIKKRRPDVNITSMYSKIQEIVLKNGLGWLRGFNSVVLCLDNQEARLWINETLIDMVEYKPYVWDIDQIRLATAKYLNNNNNNDHFDVEITPEEEHFAKKTKSSLIPEQLYHPSSLHPSSDPNTSLSPSSLANSSPFSPIPHNTLIPSDKVSLYTKLGFSPQTQSLFQAYLPQYNQTQSSPSSPPPSSSPASLPFPTSTTDLSKFIHVSIPADRNVDTITSYYEGGTEGWRGHFRSLRPGHTYCLNCTNNAEAAKTLHTHLCTIANVPRIPEHCIIYAHQLLWPKLISFSSRTEYQMVGSKVLSGESKNNQLTDEEIQADQNNDPHGVEFDADQVDHVLWCLDRAVERAVKFNIQQPTYSQTLGVIKNTIPAIASTNSLIASLCVNSLFHYDSATLDPFRTNDLIDDSINIDQNGQNINKGQIVTFVNDVYTTGSGITTNIVNRTPNCATCADRYRITISRNDNVFMVLLALMMEVWWDKDINKIRGSLAFELFDCYEFDQFFKSMIYFNANLTQYFNGNTDELLHKADEFDRVGNNSQNLDATFGQKNGYDNVSRSVVYLLKQAKEVFKQKCVYKLAPQTKSLPPIKFDIQFYD
jgi:hypothetical protein